MALSLVITSCEKEEEEDSSAPHITTLSSEQGDYNKVYASGQISNLNPVALDFECGIEYSTNASFDKDSTWQVKAPKNYSEETYTVELYPIESERTYYYRAYCINQMLIYYGETKQLSFYWEHMKDELLIGTWDATDGYRYVLNENHTGVMSSIGRSLNMEWNIEADRLNLIFKSSGQAGKSAYLTFVINSLTESKMEAYDSNDPDKEIITFTK